MGSVNFDELCFNSMKDENIKELIVQIVKINQGHMLFEYAVYDNPDTIISV